MKNQALTIDDCRALYFDSNALIEPTRKLYRLNGYSSGRYYYTYNDDGRIDYFISVTNLIKSTMPTGENLVKWIADMGYDNAREFAQQRADYGTFMHAKFQHLLMNRKLDLDALGDDLMIYLQNNNLPTYLLEEWLNDIKKDVIGFAQFLKTHKVIPMAIEVVLASSLGFAGAVDLVCLMTINETGFHGEVYKTGDKKGQPKETKEEITVLAVVDFKSGRKNFYEEHEIQLEAYKELVKENFPHLDCSEIRLFNYSPNEWRTQPGFKLKDQTASPNREKFQHLIKLAAIEMSKRERALIKIEGVLDLDEPVENFYSEITIDDLIIMLERDRIEREFVAIELHKPVKPKKSNGRKNKKAGKSPKQQAAGNRKNKGRGKNGKGVPKES